jgi:RNA 2',3'-cyclic 3'-phosphodiesterase
MSAGPSEAPAAPPAAERDAGARRRMFYALWPDAAAREALSRATRDAQRHCGGRPTASENLHLTLAFLGALAIEQVERALGLDVAVLPAFELTLDTLGFSRRSRVLWLAPSAVPAPLCALERAVWDGLSRLGFEREPRPFKPHVTLCRRARADGGAPAVVHWTVERFALVESLPDGRGVRYEPLGFWRLGTGGRF